MEEIKEKLNDRVLRYFHDNETLNLDDNETLNLDDNETLNSKYFRDYLYERFNNGSKDGFYGWNGLRYFLYEYEMSLLSESRHKKVFWEDFLKTPKDKVSIEHVFPQTPTRKWKPFFPKVRKKDYHLYGGSLGNLLLLSRSINSSLQNDEFKDKKHPKKNKAGEKIRNGYSDGSHSEIEVSRCENWTPEEIEKRGMRLLDFMERRWNFKFENEEAKRKLLFLNRKDAAANR